MAKLSQQQLDQMTDRQLRQYAQEHWVQKPKGRPSIGEQPLSKTERQRRWRQAQKTSS